MTVEHLEILVEELSTEAALRILLPKIVGSLSFEIYRFQGKRDLLERLPGRLRGYAAWLPATSRILVLVDRDAQDCHQLKEILERAAVDAQLKTRSNASGGPYQVINRIAIEELEAWYFGDWDAVSRAYPKVSKTVPAKAKFRNPDAVPGGTWEAFERELNNAGYFVGGLRKIEAARAVAEHMVPAGNRSRSFQNLRDALMELAA